MRVEVDELGPGAELIALFDHPEREMRKGLADAFGVVPAGRAPRS